jgi:glycosyltransferase involved in cell wall biosynthesis
MDGKKVLKKTAFISTVFNEAKSVSFLLESLMAQTCLPSEIVIVDGGSTDGTTDIISGFFRRICINFSVYPNSPDEIFKEEKLIFEGETFDEIKVKLFIAENVKISRGRNMAIKNTGCEYICVSDGGCILKKNWLQEISGHFYGNEGDDGNEFIVGGYSNAIADTLLKACLAACVMPRKNEIDPKKFMPSSRNICFSRQSWERAGMYPENMDFGEDMKFNFNMLKYGYRIEYDPDAEVYWNMRSSIASIFRQFFRYAKGDAIGRMYPKRHMARIVSIVAFIAVISASILINPMFALMFLPLFVLYTLKPYLRIDSVLDNCKSINSVVRGDKTIHVGSKKEYNIAYLKMLFFVPFLLIFIDSAKTCGYFYGLFTGQRSVK